MTYPKMVSIIHADEKAILLLWNYDILILYFTYVEHYTTCSAISN